MPCSFIAPQNPLTITFKQTITNFFSTPKNVCYQVHMCVTSSEHNGVGQSCRKSATAL